MLILFIFLIDIKNTGIPLLFVSEMNDSVSLVIAVLHWVTKIEDTTVKLGNKELSGCPKIVP